MSASLDDKNELLSKRNSLCGKINNVLCCFWKRDPLVKLNLLRWYCSDFYGSVLWDMTHSTIEDVCVAWRKGLRRVWDLPTTTHSKFVTSRCGLPQLKVELACRCIKFISKCLNSPNYVVRHVVKQGVYFQRLYTPIGRNAHHCVTMVDASLSDIASNTRKLFRLGMLIMIPG